MTVQLKPHLFTVDDVEQMIETGILSENDKVELIEGQLIAMSPIGSQHVAFVNRLVGQFAMIVVNKMAITSVQNPINLNWNSRPEPDIALLSFREDYYVNALPTTEDVLLVIEVSDSSLAYDETTKLSLYASAGIKEVWIVSIENNWIDCYRHPVGKDYRLRERFFPGDTVQPDLVPEGAVDVTAILGV